MPQPNPSRKPNKLLEAEFGFAKKGDVLSRGGVRDLASRDGDGGGLASAGLRLSNHVSASDDRHHRSLLDRRGLVEPVAIDPAEEIVAQAHAVETHHGLHAGRSLKCRHSNRHASVLRQRRSGLRNWPCHQRCRHCRTEERCNLARGRGGDNNL